MLSIFNGIRRQLLSEDRFTAYARYAVGEIVLVVLGILIALQINNWNENRKEQNKLHKIYALVAADLKDDINDIEALMKEQSRRKVIIDRILDNDITREEFESCAECRFVLIGFPNFSIDQRGYNLLKNLSVGTEIDSNSLQIAISQFYAKYLYDLEGDDQVRLDSLKNNIFYWEEHTDWYADFISDRDYSGFVEYAVTSQDFKNRVAMYRLLHFQIYVPILFEFKKDASDIIKRIEQELIAHR